MGSNSYDVNSYRETQYRILQSRSLAERVVNDLGLCRLLELYMSHGILVLWESNPKPLPLANTVAPPDTSADYYRDGAAFLNARDQHESSAAK